MKRALIEASKALEYSALGYGTDCDVDADVVNSDVEDIIRAVRAGRPTSEILSKLSALDEHLKALKRCLKVESV
jgi:hypothetical protein